jgi:hypothetical protein
MSEEEFSRGLEDGKAERKFRESTGIAAPILEVLGGTDYNPPADPEGKRTVR